MWKLAWKFIKYDRAKSVGIITAIVISIFLIGQQLSLLLYLMGLMGNLVGNAAPNDRELWIIEGQSKNFNAVNRIDQRLAQEIGSLNGIERTHPIVFAPSTVSFLDGKSAAVTLVGSPTPAFIMGPESERIAEGQIADLAAPASVSAEFYNAKSWGTDLFPGKAIEING